MEEQCTAIFGAKRKCLKEQNRKAWKLWNIGSIKLKCSLNQFTVSNSAAGNDPGGCFFGGDADEHRDISGRHDRRWIYRGVSSRAGGGEPYQ